MPTGRRAEWIAFVASMLLSVLVGPARSHAQAPLELGAHTEAGSIGPASSVLLDASRELTAEQVASLPLERFSPVTTEHPSWGFTSSVVWMRFELRNTTPERREYVLDATREWVDHVALFEVTPEGAHEIGRSGSQVPIARRPVASTRIALPLELRGAASRVLLLRVESRSPVAVDGILRTRRSFANNELKEQLVFGGYYALLLGFAVSSLLLFLALREPRQLHVALVLGSYALAEAAAHGHLSILLPFAAGWLELGGSAVGFGGFIASVIAGTLAAARAEPRPAGRWARALPWLGAAPAFASALAPSLYSLTFLALASTALVTVGLAVRGAHAGVREARYYLLGVMALMIPGGFTLATLIGALPTYAAVEYGNHVGAVVMSLLFSLMVVGAIRRDRARISALTEDTTALNVQLETRLVELDGAVHAAQRANEELRFQIVERSRALVGILASHPGPVVSSMPGMGELVGGRYRLVRVLGAGAWGLVYEVTRESDGGRFALKVLTRARTGQQAARLAQEAEIGARLQHENLVRIVDVGVLSGASPYVVMELVEGGSLEEQREARFGDVAWMLPILHGVARGLAAVHEAKVSHRDVKPANVLLDTSRGTIVARLADFGIARPELFDVVDPSPLNAPRLTAMDTLLGTPAYMPPEAARSTDVGSAGDVFAFGVLAYEGLGGASPYRQLPVYLALAGIPIGDPGPLGTDSPLVTPELRQRLRAAISIEPSERPAMRELVEVLAAAVAAASQPTRTTPPAGDTPLVGP